MQTESETKKPQQEDQGEAPGTEAAAEPEAEGGAPEGEAARDEQPRDRPRGGSPVMLAVALLALLVAAGGTGAGYYVWQQSVAARQQLESRTGEIDSALQGVRAGVQGLRGEINDIETRLGTALGAELGGLREEVKDLRETVARVRTAQRQGPEPVIEPARVEHLLQIANDSLILERDVGTALAALRAADRSLRDLDNPLFAETRRRLAEEVAALESLPRPDIPGIAFALGSMQERVSSLPPAQRARPAGDAQAGGAESAQQQEEIAGWRAFLRDVWEALKGLVVVRRSEPDDAPLLKPDQRMFLTQNLYLKLETARLALLERDQRNFSASLTAARSWLERYYDTGATAVTAMLQRLEELGAADISPQMPDISGSLDALRAALERRSQVADGVDDPA